MERCQGFTIPKNKCFYVVSFEDLAYFDLNTGDVIELEDWDMDESRNLILLNNQEIPFIGVSGGNPLLNRADIGQLILSNSVVTLSTIDGRSKKWEMENFSGDWEHVSFDSEVNGFLFGAPYDFDYRFIELD